MTVGESGAGSPQVATQPAAEPMFSIMCSAYQCEDYLAATIESVLAQEHPGWELIVVDNGMSTPWPRSSSATPVTRACGWSARRTAGSPGASPRPPRSSWPLPGAAGQRRPLTPQLCGRMAAVLEAHPGIDALSCDAFLFIDSEDLDWARSFLRRTVGLDHRLTLADLIGESDVVPCFAAFRRDAWFACGGYAPGDDLVEEQSHSSCAWSPQVTDVRVLPGAAHPLPHAPRLVIPGPGRQHRGLRAQPGARVHGRGPQLR